MEYNMLMCKFTFKFTVMRRLYILFNLLFISFGIQAQLTIEKIMEDPVKWIGTSPSNIFWGDDSKTVYFNWNPEQNLADSLYKISLIDKSPHKVTIEERRSIPDRYTVTYSKDNMRKLYMKEGDVFIKDMSSGQERRLTETLEPKNSPSFNTDETKVVFKKGTNLFTLDLKDGHISQLTNFVVDNNKSESVLNDADKILVRDQQELFMVLREANEKKKASEHYVKSSEIKRLREIPTERKQVLGLVASPNLQYIFYKLRDNNKENINTIIPNYVTESGYTEDIHGRSKVGDPGKVSAAYIYHFEKDTILKLMTDSILGITEQPLYLDEYKKDTTQHKPKARAVEIFGPIWSPSGNRAVVVVRSQDNKDRWIMQLNPDDGSLTLIDRQRDEAWVGGPGIGGYYGTGEIGFIDENTLYYQSEATGYSHLYSYDFMTASKKQLTSGDFEVQEVQLSQDKKWFYLTTNEVHPGTTHFYRMAVTGGNRTQLTSMKGGNEVYLSPDEKTLAIRYSNANTPWELYIQENKSRAKAEKITSSQTAAFKAYPWKMPEVISFKARDGKEIYARVYQPRKKNGKGVVFVHGAGYLQNAHNWWSQYFREYMFHNLLVDKGYTVMDIDYRASSGYGREVRTGIYRHMGGKDLDDNVDGARLLVSKYGVNPKKIGVYGGSYGGFITLMAMFTTPDVFATGAALRPVTDWSAYNQGYTSNILNEPHMDSIAYRRSSPIFFADGLKGQLLICHGQVDVNVHIQDSYRLIQRLIELRKENWEMASYPVEDHGFVHPTSWMDEYKRILKLFESM